MNVVQFRKDLEELINKHSMESASDTPDFILADFLFHALELHTATTNQRDKWYDRPQPTEGVEMVPQPKVKTNKPK